MTSLPKKQPPLLHLSSPAIRDHVVPFLDGNTMVDLGQANRFFRTVTGVSILQRYTATVYEQDEKTNAWRPRQVRSSEAAAVVAMRMGPTHFRVVGRMVFEGLQPSATFAEGRITRPLQSYAFASQCKKAIDYFKPPAMTFDDQWSPDQWREFPRANFTQSLLVRVFRMGRSGVADQRMLVEALNAGRDLEVMALLSHTETMRQFKATFDAVGWSQVLAGALVNCPHAAEFLINQSPRLFDVAWKGNDGNTLLIIALTKAPHLVSSLLKADVSLDAATSGMTPLMTAFARAPEHVPALLKKGASVHGEHLGWTPLKLAVKHAPEYLPLLWDAGIPVVSDFETLALALQHAHDYVPQILNGLPNLKTLPISEQSTIMLIAIKAAPQFVPELIYRGLPVTGERNGYTPLICALQYAPQHVSLLLHHGARVEGVTLKKGYTALMMALRYSPQHMPDLLARGAKFAPPGNYDDAAIIRLVDHDLVCPPLTAASLRLIPTKDLVAGTPERNAMTVAQKWGREADHRALCDAIAGQV